MGRAEAVALRGEQRMRIIDTHLHLIHLDRFGYPWLDGVPPLRRTFTLDEYLPQARAVGITDMLHMEVDAAERDMEAEIRFVTGLGRGIIGAVAACRPESEDFPAYLDEMAANPKVKGFRRVLHTQPDTLPQAPLFADNLKRLAAHGFPFDLCVLPRQIPIAADIARRYPDVQFVLDHCGVPNIKDREIDPWRCYVSEIATLPNVVCKISGVIAYGDPGSWTEDDLRPYVDHAIQVFGWDRVVWGSDWPVCTLTADLGRWMEATHDLLQGTSREEREKLFSRNAERIYRLA